MLCGCLWGWWQVRGRVGSEQNGGLGSAGRGRAGARAPARKRVRYALSPLPLHAIGTVSSLTSCPCSFVCVHQQEEYVR